jgi:hypothetical protein
VNETIFHLDNNGKLTELNEANYISEDLLQQLLADYPKLISGSQINSLRPRRWLLISREFGVPDNKDAIGRWSLDHLFIDQDGIPTLVEVKRSTDTRIRREVIGQILDYAANAVTYWTIEEIIHRFDEQCKSLNQDSIITLQDFLQGENEADNFWELTKTNLKAGKIRMLIIADSIPKELQRIIEFLNEQMTPAEILGLEIKQFVGHDNIKTLVPRVIGQTTTADTTKGINKGKESPWTEDTFFSELTAQRGVGEAEVVRQLLNWLKPQMTRIWYGSGKKGSMVPVFTHMGVDHFPIALWTYGTVEINFQWHKHKPPFDSEQKRLELLNKLNQIIGVSISPDRISARPNFPISLLANKIEYQKFIDIYKWFIEEVKNNKLD